MGRSKAVQSLYKTAQKRDVPPKILWISRAFGVFAAIFLVTGLVSSRPLVNLIGASVCFYATVWTCTAYERMHNKGKNKVLGSTLMRDIELTVAWTLLMIPWLLEIFGE